MLNLSARVGGRLRPPRAQGYAPQSLDDLYFERDAVPVSTTLFWSGLGLKVGVWSWNFGVELGVEGIG